MSEDTKQNISKAKIETWKDPEYRALKLNQMKKNWVENTTLRSGENSGNWKGGISYEEYGKEFNDTLKDKIRERDDYTCNLCLLKDAFTNSDVHHIDYNKKNNKPWNLITLCHSCHTKTNTRDRSNWMLWFKGLVFEKYKNLYKNQLNPII